jgi:hypothetical protein
MSDPRKLLADAWKQLDSEQHDELAALAMQMWKESLSAMQQKWSYCPNCRQKVQADYVDFLTRAKALEIFSKEAFGAIPTTHHVEVDYGEKTLEALRAMPMAELARYAAIDAEWDEVAVPELPPAA